MSEDKIIELARDIQHIRADQASMRAAIERMSEAVTRLALVEERQAATSHAIERVMGFLEKIDERVRKLEIADPIQVRSSEWVDKAVWALVSALVMFVSAKIGLF